AIPPKMAEYRVFPLSGSAEPEELRKKRFRSAPLAYHPCQHHGGRVYRRRSSKGCRCCCCLCASIAILLFLFFIAASVVYLLLQPKAPNFSVARAYITQFNVTMQPIKAGAGEGRNVGVKQPSFYLQTDLNFTAEIKNPNKKIGIYFEQVDVGLGYEGLKVGNGSLPSFYVGVKASTEIELQVKGQDAPLPEKAGLGLQKAMNTSDKMWVQVELAMRARIRVWGRRSKAFKALVYCNVEMSTPRPHTNAHILSKSCRLKFLSLLQ
ncbi:hypothetical protein GOP47_0021128, partial [Adiantum capillus-veneris]